MVISLIETRYFLKNQTSCKIGYCSKCGRSGIPLTEHHIFKRSVFGNNDNTVLLCRECHNDLENQVRFMENMILRLFKPCYSALYYRFMDNKVLEEKDIVSICMKRISGIVGNFGLMKRLMHKKGG